MIKSQILNPKFQTNPDDQNSKDTNLSQPYYDLEERTYRFSKNICIFCKTLVQNDANSIFLKQLIRSSSSIGANYIEANESLSRKDFRMRIKICRKEAKESAYWLGLLIETNSGTLHQDGSSLRNEALQFRKIFSSILLNSS